MRKSRLIVQSDWMSEDYYIYEESDQPLSSYINIDHISINNPAQHALEEKSRERGRKSEKKERRGRKKQISKQSRGGVQKGQKRKGEESTVTGRPNNLGPENQHLTENRSYNDIVYHYARFLIFFKLMPADPAARPLDLPAAHQHLLADTHRALSSDPYPLPHQSKPVFLLHPGSLHAVLQFQREKLAKIAYSSSEMKWMLLIFLEWKGLLRQSVVEYLDDYWKDIVYLVNHPEDGAADIQQHPRDYHPDLGPSDVGPLDDMGFLQDDDPAPLPEEPARRKRLAPSEEQLMRRQLAADRSIVAYEIACYLFACCCKYTIAIAPEP